MHDDSDGSPEAVPGYGWVVWPGSRLDESAHRFVGLHRPEPDDDWYGGQGCQYCGRRWPCAEARWAADRLGRIGVVGTVGRHRLRRLRRLSVGLSVRGLLTGRWTPRRVVVIALLLCCVLILFVP